MPYAAENCARAALQHAVTAQWVLLTADSERDVLAEMKRNHSTTLQDVSSHLALPDNLLEDIEKGPTYKGPARWFWQMCERFSPDKTLYVLYRRMSDSVHPSLRTFVYHLEADDQRGVFALNPRSPGPYSQASRVMACS